MFTPRRSNILLAIPMAIIPTIPMGLDILSMQSHCDMMVKAVCAHLFKHMNTSV